MSSRRFQEDIRRIVGKDDTQGGLDDALPRMRIDGQRGIYMIGAGETKSGASPGETEDGEATDPIMPDENDDNQNEDGAGTGGPGTDPSETDPDDFEIDPDDTGNYSPDDSTFGGNWASGGPVSFVDCESDKCIEVVGRGGYVPPAGWDDADVPPINEGYQPGFYWLHNEYTGMTASTPAGLMRQFPVGVPRRTYFISQRTYDNNGGLSGVIFGYSTEFGYVTDDHSSAGRVSCSGSTTGVCSPDDPDIAPNSWPADNCIQLAKNDAGQWAASQYENPGDMTAKYSETKSTLDLCTPNGDGVQVLPGADGGDVYWNYTQGRYRAVSPDGRQSFGGATEVTTAVAGSAAGGGAIKPKGAPVPGA